MTRRTSQVVPAILTDSPEALETMMRQAETFTSYVQFDIMDGQFVPSHSINVQHLAQLATKLTWEAHLMVNHPEEHLAEFRKAGARKVIFHYEATDAPSQVISLARRLGLEVGVAVNPETAVAAVLPLVPQVDSVLFLSVHPGFYGAKFIPEVLDKITDFRRQQPDTPTGIDGGIKENNITEVARTGVDCIYVGSAIFLQPQPGDGFRRLTALAREASAGH